MYTLNEVVHSRLEEDKATYAFFLGIKKAYDTVWHDGLWLKLWEIGVRGRMWWVFKAMHEASRSAVCSEGEMSVWSRCSSGLQPIPYIVL